MFIVGGSRLVSRARREETLIQPSNTLLITNYLQDLVHAEVWEGRRSFAPFLPKPLHVLGPVFDL